MAEVRPHVLGLEQRRQRRLEEAERRRREEEETALQAEEKRKKERVKQEILRRAEDKLRVERTNERWRRWEAAHSGYPLEEPKATTPAGRAESTAAVGGEDSEKPPEKLPTSPSKSSVASHTVVSAAPVKGGEEDLDEFEPEEPTQTEELEFELEEVTSPAGRQSSELSLPRKVSNPQVERAETEQEEENEQPVEPLEVKLPSWHPEQLPVPELHLSDFGIEGSGETPQPTVTPMGDRALLVAWELPSSAQRDWTWHLRVRQVGDGDRWHAVDLDRGKVEDFRDAEAVKEPTWKHKAYIAQPGLRVLSYYVDAGLKSDKPGTGKVLMHSPGMVMVEFEEPEDAYIGVQLVPQNWVVLCNTERTLDGSEQVLRKLSSTLGMLASKQHAQALAAESKGKRRSYWGRAKRLFESIVLENRHCAIIWRQQLVPMPSGSRVACHCRFAGSGKSRARRSSFGALEPRSLSWWPAVMTTDSREVTKAQEWPSELIDRSELYVDLEPYPRIQVIPRTFVYEEEDLPEARRAAENLIPGQQILAHYVVSGSAEHLRLEPLEKERFPYDVTFKPSGAEGEVAEWPPVRSERAVCCTIVREAVDPREVIVVIKGPRSGGPGWETSLTEIEKISQFAKGDVKASSFDVWGWELRRVGLRSFQVIATVSPRDSPNLRIKRKLQQGHVVTVGRKKGQVERIDVTISHLEVEFDVPDIPDQKLVSAHSLPLQLRSRAPRRSHQPALVLRELPRDLTEVEVQVGCSDSDSAVTWSISSAPCAVRASKELLEPLKPVVETSGSSRAEVRWIAPKDSLAYRVLLQKDGEEWRFVDGAGHAKESAVNLAPLLEGAWVSAYGIFDNSRAATPAPGRVRSVSEGGDLIGVDFEKPSEELRLGKGFNGTRSLTWACTGSFQCTEQGEEQQLGKALIDAVWVSDKHSFHQAVPLGEQKLWERIFFTPEQESFTVEQFPGLLVEEPWLDLADADRGRDGKRLLDMFVCRHALTGLKPEAKYKVRIQILTEGGWSDPSESADCTMSRIGYKVEDLVYERPNSVFYRSGMLPQALYKQYDSCYEFLEEALPEDRLQRLGAVMAQRDSAEKLRHLTNSKLLVDIEGPLRECCGALCTSDRMEEMLQEVKKLVEERANVNFQSQASGRTPLTLACEYICQEKELFQKDVVVALLDLRADVDSRNHAQSTALAIAAQRGLHRAVEILLDRKANPTVTNNEGKTALLMATADFGESPEALERIEKVRALLEKDRVHWKDFEDALSAAKDAVSAAKAFQQLACPEGAKHMFSDGKYGKEISKFDRLRLREQLQEVADDEQHRRGQFCASLLLRQMEAATEKECHTFVKYLLMSGILQWCHEEGHKQATKILEQFEEKFNGLRGKLQDLPTLDKESEFLTNMQTESRKNPFNGRKLHQWHAHNELPWLTEHNVVGAFEALILSGAMQDMEDFSNWIGELNARLKGTAGAWNAHLPMLFWGDAYVRFLLGEASRAAPIFQSVVGELIKDIPAKFLPAPNKNYGRIVKKQIDYASPGLLLLYTALDLMPGCFRRAWRGDLPGQHKVLEDGAGRPPGATLVIGSAQQERLVFTQEAVKQASSAGGQGLEALILVVLLEGSSSGEDAEEDLRGQGAHAVLTWPRGLEGPEKVKAFLYQGLEEALQAQRQEVSAVLPSLDSFVTQSAEEENLLLDMRKCKTGDPRDLLCAGGLLDLVRGTITCSKEADVVTIYERALELKAEVNQAELLRVKNGFRTPAVGGYADLKLFLLIAHEPVTGEDQPLERKVCHICELQVHLKEFLELKEFTHMPYVIDRGDFD